MSLLGSLVLNPWQLKLLLVHGVLIFGDKIFIISIQILLVLVLIARWHAIQSNVFNLIAVMILLLLSGYFLVMVWFHQIVVAIGKVLIVSGHGVLGVLDTPIAEQLFVHDVFGILLDFIIILLVPLIVQVTHRVFFVLLLVRFVHVEYLGLYGQDGGQFLLEDLLLRHGLVAQGPRVSFRFLVRALIRISLGLASL